MGTEVLTENTNTLYRNLYQSNGQGSIQGRCVQCLKETSNFFIQIEFGSQKITYQAGLALNTTPILWQMFCRYSSQ
jgi:hypothetical protein